MSEHELWNELGNLYFLSGAYAQAVHAYHRAIKLEAAFGKPYSNLALTYVRQGKFQEAVELYRKSIELLMENKEKAISWNRLGDVFRYLRDYRQAVVAYRRADDLDPENGNDDDMPGWLSEPARNEMPSELTQAREMDSILPVHPGPASETTKSSRAPRLAGPRNVSAATWALAGPSPYQQDVSQAPQPGALTTWGDPALEDPEADWPFESETDIYFPDMDGDDLTRWIPVPDEVPQDLLEPAAEDLGEGLEVEEPFPDVGPIVAALTMAKSGPPHSRPAIDAAASSGPSNTSVKIEVILPEHPTAELAITRPPAGQLLGSAASGDAKRNQGDSEASTAGIEPARDGAAIGAVRDDGELREIQTGLARFKRVVELNPRNAHAWDSLGNLYKASGQYKEALLAYQQAISNDPSRALYHHHLALVYAHEGRMEDAIDALQRVIEIDPDHSLAHAALGGYYRKLGLEELAQKHVGKAMKSIFDSENEYNRACLAAICGDTDQAIRLLRVALQNRQTYVDWILRDPDLDFIRQDPRFKQLISDYAR